MGVYIPGMEMPTCCETCILDHKFFKWLECNKHVTGDMIRAGRRSPDCPLVPAADVRPVKRGKWMPKNEIGDCCYQCSDCGFVRDAYILDIGNYCPNCGADMREKS